MTIFLYWKGLERVTLDLPDDSDLDDVYSAVQGHYADLYGKNFIVEVRHQCSTLDDPELDTEAHMAQIYAARIRPWARRPARPRWIASISFSLKRARDRVTR